MDDDVAAARERVIAAMEQSAAEYGLPRSAGRIYGILYFAAEPVSMDDLAEHSGYAKSTVSDVTGALEDLYLVRRASVPAGGRKAYFEAERDLWYATRRVMQDHGRREIELMTRALAEAEAELETADGGEAQLERVRELQELYREFDAMLDLLQRVPFERLLGLLSRFVGDSTRDDLDEDAFEALDADEREDDR